MFLGVMIILVSLFERVEFFFMEFKYLENSISIVGFENIFNIKCVEIYVLVIFR